MAWLPPSSGGRQFTLSDTDVAPALRAPTVLAGAGAGGTMLTEEVRERLPTEEGSRTALPALVSRTRSLLGCGTLSTVTPGRAGLKAVKRGIKAAHARHPQPVSDEVTAGPVSTSRVMGSITLGLGLYLILLGHLHI